MSETGIGRESPGWQLAETGSRVELYGAVRSGEGRFAIRGCGPLAADIGRGWEMVSDDRQPPGRLSSELLP